MSLKRRKPQDSESFEDAILTNSTILHCTKLYLYYTILHYTIKLYIPILYYTFLYSPLTVLRTAAAHEP